MTLDAAIYEAQRRAKGDNFRGLYVVRSRELFDPPGPDHEYHLCGEDELDTFFLGAPIAAYVDSCGEVQYGMF